MASLEEPAIRNVSDTALWVALYRAQESERPDALFHDPYARRLAGERGARIAAEETFASRNLWSFTARTVLLDRIIEQQIASGADMVINLAAGLDTRPYRLPLPPQLRWVEVDLAPMLEYKASILREAEPHCQLQRQATDLADPAARQALFARLGDQARRVLVITEGLLIYFMPATVAALARDLATPASFQAWALDFGSPGLLRMMNRKMGTAVAQAGTPFRFAPAEGTKFFQPCGWHATEVHTLLRAALGHHRLSWPLTLAAWLPQSHPGKGNRPWSAVCLLERTR
ncbi:MAG: class I SAM-dependent methyltransferase [Terriglobales bacterium]